MYASRLQAEVIPPPRRQFWASTIVSGGIGAMIAVLVLIKAHQDLPTSICSGIIAAMLGGPFWITLWGTVVEKRLKKLAGIEEERKSSGEVKQA